MRTGPAFKIPCDKRNREEYEIRDGKPYLGVWVGKFITLRRNVSENWQEDLKDLIIGLKYRDFPEDLEERHKDIIFRPAYTRFGDPLNQLSTLAVKYLVWGRAFKVLKYFKKGAKKYKKVWLNGHRKRVRVF